MKEVSVLLSQILPEYLEYSEQDALQFFINIHNVMPEAFPSELMFVSY